MVDETDQGPETSAVPVDETLAVADRNVPALMRLCRSHWSALCWLCWSAGLDRVALPTTLEPPPSFASLFSSVRESFFPCLPLPGARGPFVVGIVSTY